jgi:hypothetical protein
MNDTPLKQDDTPTNIFNPLSEDFTWTMANEQNEKVEYTMPSMSISTFPKYLADHMARHLAQKIAMKNMVRVTPDGPMRITYQQAYDEALESLRVTL